MFRHRGDDPDLASARCPPVTRRAGIGAALRRGPQFSVAELERATDIRGGELGLAVVELAVGHRHVLDEAWDRADAPRVLAELDDLAVVDAAQRDRVDLDRQAGAARRVDAGEDARQIASTG